MILANWKSDLVNKRNYSEEGQAQTLVCANNSFSSLQYVWESFPLLVAVPGHAEQKRRNINPYIISTRHE